MNVADPKVTEGFLVDMIEIEATSDSGALRLAADWLEGKAVTLLSCINIAKDATGGNLVSFQVVFERHADKDGAGT